jgi:hypothetical protein
MDSIWESSRVVAPKYSRNWHLNHRTSQGGFACNCIPIIAKDIIEDISLLVVAQHSRRTAAMSGCGMQWERSPFSKAEIALCPDMQ